MRLAKAITLAGATSMAAVLVFAFTQGDFFGEGAKLLSMPWGIVSLVDLYVGFTLFSCWVIFQEASPARAVFWIVMIMILGFFAASLYAFLALRASGGEWRRVWLGKHAM